MAHGMTLDAPSPNAAAEMPSIPTMMSRLELRWFRAGRGVMAKAGEIRRANGIGAQSTPTHAATVRIMAAEYFVQGPRSASPASAPTTMGAGTRNMQNNPSRRPPQLNRASSDHSVTRDRK